MSDKIGYDPRTRPVPDLVPDPVPDSEFDSEFGIGNDLLPVAGRSSPIHVPDSDTDQVVLGSYPIFSKIGYDPNMKFYTLIIIVKL